MLDLKFYIPEVRVKLNVLFLHFQQFSNLRLLKRHSFTCDKTDLYHSFAEQSSFLHVFTQKPEIRQADTSGTFCRYQQTATELTNKRHISTPSKDGSQGALELVSATSLSSSWRSETSVLSWHGSMGDGLRGLLASHTLLLVFEHVSPPETSSLSETLEVNGGGGARSFAELPLLDVLPACPSCCDYVFSRKSTQLLWWN